KTKKADFAHGSGFGDAFTKWKFGSNRLRGVFDQNEPVALRNFTERVHLAGQTKQMHRNHCADFFSVLRFPCAVRIKVTSFLDAFLISSWPNVIRSRIDFCEKWSGADSGKAVDG